MNAVLTQPPSTADASKLAPTTIASKAHRRRLHICQLNTPTEYYSPISGGAIATDIMEQTHVLQERGHRVTVMTIYNQDPLHAAGQVVPIESKVSEEFGYFRRKWSNLRCKLAGWDWPKYEHYRKSYRRAFALLNPAPDVVIVHNDWVTPREIKRILPKTKVLAWMHNEQRTFQRNVPRALRSIDMVLTVSDYINSWVRAHFPIPAEKVRTVLNGVNLETFTSTHDYLATEKELRVLFLGRIDPNKGPDIAVDAVAALRKEGVPIRITVAGPLWWHGVKDPMQDPYFRELKAKMDAAGAEYLGHVTRPHVPELIRRHDVACVLSRSNEPFALVALEAMASGCAVIASNRGGLPEACGGAAILVNPDNLQAVIDSLRLFATNRNALADYKRKAVARAAWGGWTSRVSELEDAIYSVVQD